jgi:hypothetical protein
MEPVFLPAISRWPRIDTNSLPMQSLAKVMANEQNRQPVPRHQSSLNMGGTAEN